MIKRNNECQVYNNDTLVVICFVLLNGWTKGILFCRRN